MNIPSLSLNTLLYAAKVARVQKGQQVDYVTYNQKLMLPNN